MYSFESRIRYSETDSSGRLTLEALLDYFQDCSIFQSEDIGLGIAYLKTQNLVWVLSSWQIVTQRYPGLGEQVEVGTFPSDFRGCFGHRNFFMKDADGVFLAKANSLWTLLDTSTMRPVKVPAAMAEKYSLEPPLEMEYAPRKVEVRPGGVCLEPVEVLAHHLDSNRHVNNGQYVRMAARYLEESFTVRQLRVEYKKQALLHDKLYPYVVSGEDQTQVSLRDEAGEVYVNVEFEGELC